MQNMTKNDSICYVFYFQIYVPIFEKPYHWYLMVICVQQGVIYHLDSHLTIADIDGRSQRIETLVSHVSFFSTCRPFFFSDL